MRFGPIFLMMAASALACSRDGNNNGGGTKTDAGTVLPPAGNCPESDVLTVCDLKLDGNSKQPAIEDAIVLESAVVTTAPYAILRSDTGTVALGGFFVQDEATTDALARRYSGILVTYYPNQLSGNLPDVGDVVRIEGLFKEFGQASGPRQKQLQATFVSAIGTSNIEPVTISDPATLVSGEVAKAYEGVLVRLTDVTAIKVRDIPGAGTSSIFGAFQVTGGLVISGSIFQYRARENETFSSITGPLRLGTAPFDSGIYQLMPRAATDVVSTNPTTVVSSIVTLQDPNAPGRPEICFNQGNMTVGVCPRVELEDVVVTAVGGYVSANLRAMFVQDPTVADGRYAGVKVVYGRDRMDVPAVGARLRLRGEAIAYFRGMQIQGPNWEANGMPNMELQPLVVQPSAIAATETPEMNPYEGVLVQINDVTVTERCVESNGRDFGYWQVTGGVLVSNMFEYAYDGDQGPNSMQCSMGTDCSCAGMSRPNDLRTLGDEFGAIIGVTDYSFDNFRLQPRGNADLVEN